MKKRNSRKGHSYASGLLLCALMVFAGCSTTSNLPDGEQLYIGIKEITYNEDLNKQETARQRKADSTGVITAVSNAVKAARAALEGKAAEFTEEEMNPKTLSKAARKLYEVKGKRDKKAFETAKAEVDAVLAYAPNYSLMGSSSLRSPFKPGLWIYNSFVNDSTRFGRWMFKAFASTPTFISNVSPEIRSKVAENTLHNYGYFHGKVDYEILSQRDPKKAKMAYHVTTGPVFRLDSVAYTGFTAHADSILRRYEDKKLLKRDDAFSVVNLSGEQTRISQLLRANGHYFYSPNYTTFRADTFQRKNYVQLQVRPADGLPPEAHKIWRIGDIHVNFRDLNGAHSFTLPRLNSQAPGQKPPKLTKAERQARQLRRQERLKQEGAGPKLGLRPYMFRHAIFHRYGDMYRLRFEELSLEKLSSMGIFSQFDLNYVPRQKVDSLAGQTASSISSSDTLDIYLNAVMDKLYDSSLEMNATIKSNQQVGPGLTYALAKRNAFRGGEKVSFKIYGSYEWQTGSGSSGGNSLLNSYELGTSLSFEFPRFVLPFVSSRHLRFPATTTFSLEADWRNRASFFQMVSIAALANYSWYRRRTLTHSIEVKLDYDKMLTTTHAFDSIMRENPVIETSMRDQFIPSIAYTLTYQSSRQHRNPVWLQIGIKEAGNLASLGYAAFGRSFNERDKSFFGNPFAQFLKLTGELHYTVPISKSLTLATRAFAGALFSYGNSLRAPYAEQFYVGGANSLRGFTVRSVGPGGYKSPESRYSYIDQTGDLKFEVNAEMRAHLFGNLHGALFVDAGNVWLLRHYDKYHDATFSAPNLAKIAVNTGVGLRYDMEFLVFRFDLGVPLHAPYDTGKSGWYNIPKFWRGLAFHFAIGYPF